MSRFEVRIPNVVILYIRCSSYTHLPENPEPIKKLRTRNTEPRTQNLVSAYTELVVRLTDGFCAVPIELNPQTLCPHSAFNSAPSRQRLGAARLNPLINGECGW